MLEMKLIGEHRRMMTKSERSYRGHMSAAMVVGEYVCDDGDSKDMMTKRQAKKAYGPRQVRRAMKAANRKTTLKRHDKHPQHA